MILVSIPRSGAAFLGLSLKANRTHCLAPPESFYPPGRWQEIQDNLYEEMKRGRKTLFLFGDPILSVISEAKFHLKEREIHPNKCGYFGEVRGLKDRIFTEDLLNYERMFDSWMKRHKDYNVLSVRYETILDNKDKIEDYCGKVNWLKWRPRRTHTGLVSKKELQDIKKTYKSLIKKVNQAPDIKLWKKIP